MKREDETLLHRAVRWAVKKHAGQDRDGASPLPYATHPIDVLNRLRYQGGVTDAHVLAAAALHDVVEECPVSLEEIETRFGRPVAALVEEVTRAEPMPEAIEGMPEEKVWEIRSQMLLAEIASMSPAAQAIKLADRASNLTSALVTRTGEKKARYIRQSYLILETIPREVNPALWDAVRDLLPTG